MGKLTRAQKAKIVEALMGSAGTLVEFWGEHADLADIPVDDARTYLASLLRRLPGDAWDTRLGPAE